VPDLTSFDVQAALLALLAAALLLGLRLGILTTLTDTACAALALSAALGSS
jgi:hypothetical protein